MIALAKLIVVFAAVAGGAAAVRALARKGAAMRKAAAGPAETAAIELDRCPVCGVYVPAGAGACAEAGCPRGRG